MYILTTFIPSVELGLVKSPKSRSSKSPKSKSSRSPKSRSSKSSITVKKKDTILVHTFLRIVSSLVFKYLVETMHIRSYIKYTKI